MKLTRILIQLVALGLFIFQMKNSIIKFANRPVVKQTSGKRFKDIKKPIIFFCQDAQFNYTKAKIFGYASNTKFVIGHLIDSQEISWRGKFGNATFNQLQEILFNVDYLEKPIKSSSTGDKDDWDTAEVEQVYIPQYGVCIKLRQIQRRIFIASKQKAFALVVDPGKLNAVTMARMDNGISEFGPITNGKFEGFIYEIKLQINDNLIHDGITCTNYESIGSSYGECIESAMKQRFLDWYDCLPPWFPNTSTTMICEAGRKIRLPSQEEQRMLVNEISNLIDGLDFNTINKCLPPCLTMQMNMNLISHYSNRHSAAYVRYHIHKEVTVFTDVYSYDIFSLIVDLGSSLGLWLGLSALGLFDNFIQIFKINKFRYIP